MPLEPIPSPRVEATDAGEARSRLLRALLEQDADLALLRHDESVSSLLAPAALRRIVLVDAGGPAGPTRLTAAVGELLLELRRGGPGGAETHVVACGGGTDVAQTLAKLSPRIKPVPMGFHHLDDDNRLVHVDGKTLDLLDRADARPRADAPPSPDIAARIEAALEHGRRLAEQDALLATRLRGRHRVTLAITIGCVALAGISYVAGSSMHDFALWRLGANNRGAVASGEAWRLFASAFLHADVAHLLVNMLALWSFGPLLEALLGPRRYVLLYAASALGGAIASILGPSERWSVGASGAIWGLMTAAIGIAVRPAGVLPQSVIARMRSRVWMPLVINVLYSLQPGIDMLGHLGGGLVGFVLAATVMTKGIKPVTERASPSDVERGSGVVVGAAAIVAAAAMAASVVAGIVLGRPWALRGAPEMRRVALADTGLSIEMPALIAEQTTTEQRNRVSLVTFGKLTASPVAFEVFSVPLDGEIPAEELDAFLEQEREALEEHGPEGAKLRGPAKRVTVGERPAVLIEHELNDLALATYLVVLGDREVLVRGYARKERPASWVGLEEKAAASVRLD